MKVRLIWATPNGDDLVAYISRVSNPRNQENNETAGKLISYMVKHKHWSPFEMVSACVEIETTRDIARQIIRHRSFSFQEFSQRYSVVDVMDESPLRDARMQDNKNRQNSLQCSDESLIKEWKERQEKSRIAAYESYKWAVDNGIAKEVARSVLPEGLTTSRLYMSGTLRSWIHYLEVRCHESTQLEHREIACAVHVELEKVFPKIFSSIVSN